MLLQRWRLLVAVATVAIGLIIWSSSLSPRRPLVILESIRINYWNVTMGHDPRGVPTALLSSKSTIVLKVQNAEDFWGYNVNGFMRMSIFLRQIASTNIRHFYEPRKTATKIVVELVTNYEPLYGAAPSVAYQDGVFYILYEAGLRTEAGFLPFMYKYTFTDAVGCRLTGVSAGPHHNLAIRSHRSCPRVKIN